MEQIESIVETSMDSIELSDKLSNVCYDIRGPVLQEAKRLEEEGHQILKLNIGNPAPFGFSAPDEIFYDVIQTFLPLKVIAIQKVSILLARPSCRSVRD